MIRMYMNEIVTKDVYVECPVFEDCAYKLRMIENEDCLDLLKVYSDKKAVPFFNSDNCHGDDFYYQQEEQMQQAIDYWFLEYRNQRFVRWAIEDLKKNCVIGTIELFHRDTGDYFSNCGLLRLDVRSDYESRQEIKHILSLIIPHTFSMFHCDKIATKAIVDAKERRAALKDLLFQESKELLLGHGGNNYDNYFVLHIDTL